MKSIKFKIVALSMALLMLTSSPARAVEPITTAFFISLGVHVVVGGVLWKQGVFSNTTNTGGATGSWDQSGGATGSWAAVTPDGSKIGKGAIVQWIDTKDIDTSGLPKAKHKAVTVKVDTQKLMDAAKSNPAKYPKLSAAASAQDPSTVPASNNVVGQTISFAVANRSGRVENIQITSMGAIGGATPDLSYIGKVNRLTADGYTTNVEYQFFYGAVNGIVQARLVKGNITTSVPPPVPATKAQFAQKLARSSAALTAPAGVYSDYYGEIDDYITGNSGSCSVVGTSDPLQVGTAPVATLPTPATQSAINNAIAAAGARTAAQNAVNTAQGNYNANPTPENAQKLADALRELARIVSEQIRDGIIDNPDGTHDEDDEEEDTGGFDSDPYGTQTDADLDFGTRFRDFFDQMRTTALFSLPNQFLSRLPSGGSSVMSFSAGRFGNHTFDFSLFSSLWTTLKTIILVLFAWLGVRIVTLKGGGG